MVNKIHTIVMMMRPAFDRSPPYQGVDVYYETYSVIAQQCAKLGLSSHAEAVLQKRYSMYHNSD